MNELPEDVKRFIDVLHGLPGIEVVDNSVQPIEDIEVEHLSLSDECSMLPHVAIRRSNGGNDHEALITFNFLLDRTHKSLCSLEFLSWWVTEQCRDGAQIQIRPMGFAPVKDDKIQLGNSLSFLIEMFYIEENDDIEKIIQYVGEQATSLSVGVELYADLFSES